MKTTTKTPTSRLLSYGSLALGSTAVFSTNTDAATVVNVNATTYDTGLSNLGTAGFSVVTGGFPKSNLAFSGTGVSVPTQPYFHRAADASFVYITAGSSQTFRYNNGFDPSVYGSQPSSNDNWFYAIGAADNTQRVWLQLNFGTGGGSQFSIVKAVFPSIAGELPNAAAAAAVPEPSALVLLSLGATGLMARRRRQAA